MEAVVHWEMCVGHVEISPKGTAAATKSVCVPADSSVVPLDIPIND
jgi:hypothetical protein